MKRGFTLIELLIVIAIIGSLASIVLGAVSSGRSKAQDTKIKSTLSNMRTQAANYFAENGSYGAEVSDDCESGMFLDPTFAKAIEEIVLANGGVSAVCYTNDSLGGLVADTWSVSSVLRSDGEITWCVDSDGKSALGTAQIVSSSAVCQ